MIGMMPAAFIRTGIADSNADPAHGFRGDPVHAHHLRCGVADRRAFHTELDTPGHHLNILIPRAGRSADITGCSSLKTGINALLISNL